MRSLSCTFFNRRSISALANERKIKRNEQQGREEARADAAGERAREGAEPGLYERSHAGGMDGREPRGASKVSAGKKKHVKTRKALR